MTVRSASIAVVLIGRNEGERLKRCLASIPAGIPAVYVDSGSSDGSVAYAKKGGVLVVELDMTAGFTAARARNAGWKALEAHGIDPVMVQFVDGDCELDRGWIAAAHEAMHGDPSLAVVFGRRRERHPEHSLYNRLCDEEWNVPIGPANACGGDALIRMAAIRQVGGYSDDLIAGEEPDMCLRMRQKGWTVRRIDAEMTLHDAAITTFGAWWRRTRRAGYAYAAHVRRHGRAADPQWRRQVRSILFWGMGWPLAMSALALLSAALSAALALLIFAMLAASYGIQAIRIAGHRRRTGTPMRLALQYGALTMIGKFAEAGGVLQCWSDHMRRRQARLIEYKGAA